MTKNNQKEIIKNIVQVIIIILGVAVIWPFGYGYYLLSRVIIFLGMIYLLIKTYEKKVDTNRYIFLGTAIIFNPFFLIHLTRGIRTIIDIFLIILFINIIKKTKK